MPRNMSVKNRARMRDSVRDIPIVAGLGQKRDVSTVYKSSATFNVNTEGDNGMISDR